MSMPVSEVAKNLNIDDMMLWKACHPERASNRAVKPLTVLTRKLRLRDLDVFAHTWGPRREE